MYVRLNLATNPLVSHRRFLAGSAIVGAVAGIAFLILGWHVYTLRRDAAELRARTAQYQQELATLGTQRESLKEYFAQQENARLQDRANFIKTVVLARSFNWTQMFMDLEKTLPAGIHIVRIEPKLDQGRASVRFVVGASNQEAKLKLLKAFEESKSFSHIELVAEHAADRNNPKPGGDALTLEFNAIYSTT